MDPLFKVATLAAMPIPQETIWMAMHQDYSEYMVAEEPPKNLAEFEFGERIVNTLLEGDRGHYGPLEHPHITLNFGYFPHSVMQQLRTHRVGVSFDVQSFRYTGKRIVDLIDTHGKGIPEEELEKIIYLRPVGFYTDRKGTKYEYTQWKRTKHLERVRERINEYWEDIVFDGLSEEHARGMLPFDYRQHWVFTGNVRSVMHLLDMRWKKDAQLECQWLCDHLYKAFRNWTPEIATWYEKARGKKARLAP